MQFKICWLNKKILNADNILIIILHETVENEYNLIQLWLNKKYLYDAH